MPRAWQPPLRPGRCGPRADRVQSSWSRTGSRRSGPTAGSPGTSSAPTSRSTAPTPSSATSGGSSTRSSRWSSTSSSSRSSSRSERTDYPLFVFAAILPWKWFSSAVNDGITSVTSRERIIKQVKFPKIVLPVAATTSGIVSFAFGLIPLVGLMLLFVSAPDQPVPAPDPGRSPSCSSCSASRSPSRSRPSTSSSATSPTWPGTPSGCGSTSRRRSGRSRPSSAEHPLVGTIESFNPWTPLFESYRDVIYNGTPPDWTGLFVLLIFSTVFLVLATLFFKRVEPSFAKVL